MNYQYSTVFCFSLVIDLVDKLVSVCSYAGKRVTCVFLRILYTLVTVKLYRQ